MHKNIQFPVHILTQGAGERGLSAAQWPLKDPGGGQRCSLQHVVSKTSLRVAFIDGRRGKCTDEQIWCI